MNAPSLPDPNQLHTVYISLGSNIEPERNLPRALALLQERSKVEAFSSAWRSQAVGSPGPDFLNAAARLRTPLDQPALKKMLRDIEADLGRVRGGNPNAPRTIDLDIVLFDSAPNDDDFWRVAHLAIPLSELHPGLIAPNGKTLEACAGQLKLHAAIHREVDLLPK